MPDLAIPSDFGKLQMTTSKGSEEHTMLDVPKQDSELVQDATKLILHDLDLAAVIDNLHRASDLIFLAYCGAAGFRVQADISVRQAELLRLCGECATTMTIFSQSAEEVLQLCVRSFRALLKGNEESALKNLVRCGDAAGTMATASKELKEKFEAMLQRTVEDRHAVVTAISVQVAQRADLADAQRKLKASLATHKRNKELLDKQIADLKVDLEDAKRREEKESERAFRLSIVSAVTGALSKGIGAYAQMVYATSPAGMVNMTAGAGAGALRKTSADPPDKSTDENDSESTGIK